MKVATKVILLIKEAGGECFAASIFRALQPNPNSNLRRLEDSFELSLDQYGIKDTKAFGSFVHFLNDIGLYEVSVLLIENYDPPVLACALNEVLAMLREESTSTIPNLVVPFLVEASNLKLENKKSRSEVSICGLQFGPKNNITQAFASKIQNPPQVQIYHEHLACLLHLVRVLDIPAFVLIGQYGIKSSEEGLQLIYEIGKHLANYSSLNFLKEKIVWNPPVSSKISKEPWRGFHG